MAKIRSIKELPDTQIDETTAGEIFDKLVAFASYGFNKSHAVSYSIISFWCAYMKAHYPAEFLAAHISNSDEAQTMLAIEEGARLGIRVKMPDINLSDEKAYTVLTDTQVLAPITAIKGVGEKAARMIVGAREGLIDGNGLSEGEMREEARGVVKFDALNTINGHFTGLTDFERRVYKRVVNAKVRRLLEETGTVLWGTVSEEDIYKHRIEYLGHIFKEHIAVDPADTCELNETVHRQLSRLFERANKIAAERHMGSILPTYGSKPRLMLVFDTPGWPEEKRNCMGYGDSWDFVKAQFRDELGFTAKDYYITALHKMRKPPLGFDEIEGDYRSILQAEIELLKPPVIVAFGKGPIEFFAGKGSSVRDHHGKIVMKGTIPVVCSFNPYAAIAEPSKKDEFMLVTDALKGVY